MSFYKPSKFIIVGDSVERVKFSPPFRNRSKNRSSRSFIILKFLTWLGAVFSDLFFKNRADVIPSVAKSQ